MQKKNKKKSERSKLVDSIDETFSKITRLTYCEDGYTQCVTCVESLQVWWHDGEKIRWTKGCEAGHFIKRGNYLVRWDRENVHPQCTRCNHFLGGNESAYAKYISDTYGVETLNRLTEADVEWKQSNGKAWPIGELRELRESLRAELKKMLDTL